MLVLRLFWSLNKFERALAIVFFFLFGELAVQVTCVSGLVIPPSDGSILSL